MSTTEQGSGRCAVADTPTDVSSAVVEMMRKARAPGVSLVVVNGDVCGSLGELRIGRHRTGLSRH